MDAAARAAARLFVPATRRQTGSERQRRRLNGKGTHGLWRANNGGHGRAAFGNSNRRFGNGLGYSRDRRFALLPHTHGAITGKCSG